MKSIYLSLFLLLTLQNIFAETVKNTDTYVVSGYISMQDYDKFAAELSEKKYISIVKFENCLGGNGLAGFRFAEEIKKAGLITLASGVVASSCALAFTAGRARKIDHTVVQNIIAFHGLFYPQNFKPKGRKANRELLDIYEKHIGFRFSKKVQEIILNTTEINEGVYFVSTKSGSKINSVGYYCDGKLPLVFSTCKSLSGITMESQGLLKE